MTSDDIKSVNKEYYDRIAKEWADSRNNLEYCKLEFDKISALVPSGRIIDLGCGSGRDAHLFEAAGYEYIGIDASAGLLKEARRLFPATKFIEMTLQNLEFPDTSFDIIWSFASYLHIPKSEIHDSLLEANRILKPGGYGFFAVKKGDKDGIFDSSKGKRYWSFYDKEGFTEELTKAGFMVIESWEDKRDFNPPQNKSIYLCYIVKK